MKKTILPILPSVLTIAFVLFLNLPIAMAQQTEKFKTRCGWLDNPTPANYSFYDRDGEWTIGVQGGYQVEDFEIPKFKRGQWVETPSGSYGFGCACFEMRVDTQTSRVLEIRKSWAKPLAACRKDKALRKWKDLF